MGKRYAACAFGRPLLALGRWLLVLCMTGPSTDASAQDTTQRAIEDFDFLFLTGRAEPHPCAVAAWPFAPSDYRIDAFVSASYDSNVLRNGLVRSLQRGGFVDRSTREDSRFDQGTMGRFGQIVVARAHLFTCNGRGLTGSTIGLTYHDQLGARFTKDAYDLVFFGNAAYAGRFADISGSAHERVRFMTLDFGLPGIFGPGSNFKLSVVGGLDLNTSNLARAVLYTDPLGLDLKTVLRASYMTRDTTKVPGYDNMGMAISVRKLFKLDRTAFRAWLLLGIEDLGAVLWNKAMRYSVEASTTYVGEEVENIFNIADIVVDEQTVIDRFGIGTHHRSRLRMLPFKAYAILYAPMGGRSMLSAAITQRLLTGFVPHLRSQFLHIITTHLRAGPTMDAGGFTSWAPAGWRFGLSSEFRSRRWAGMAACPNIAGWLSDRSHGAALEFALSYAW